MDRSVMAESLGAGHPEPSPVERLLLAEIDALLRALPELREHPAVVIDEQTGAVSQWLSDHGFTGRSIIDSRVRARAVILPTAWEVTTDLGEQSLKGAGLVVHLLARPLEALEETAWHVARWAHSDVVLLSAAREKHLNRSMNQELAHHFHEVRATRGAQKSRALLASGPRHTDSPRAQPDRIPRRHEVQVPEVGALQLRAYGMTFGAARLDPGTSLLLTTLLSPGPSGRREVLNGLSAVVDLGCGNGTITAALGRATSLPVLHASDDSASAVRSTRATAAANGIDPERIRLSHADGLEHHAERSMPGILRNPPFHDGGTVTKDLALHLFAEAARTLAPGGRLWCVWNSPLRYRDQLERIVGPTTQLNRDRRFTVTESIQPV
ncbi:class I SAM-dependent methyltransferase [Micrococcaceae sp. AOP34-BR2-30]